MKIDPRETPKDRCETSLSLLSERAGRWLREHQEGARPWIADREPAPSAGSGPVDVVLSGGFLRRFLESGNWTWPASRVWVLGSAVRDVLVHQFGFSDSQIGVIPREELFRAPTAPRPFPKKGAPFDLVFAGRLSPTKNIRFLLRFASSLQTEWGLPVRLHLCGEIDDDPHPDQGRREREDHGKQIAGDLARLSWIEAPVLHGKKGPGEWLGLGFQNPVLANFSTFICEDFDVSLAQARGAGWPCLISDWGGHRDVHGAGVRKVPADRLASTHEPLEWIDLKARALAAECARNWDRPDEIASESSLAIRPVPVTQEQLDSLRRRLVEKTGPDLHWVLREGLEAFADTDAGRGFFRRSRFLFGVRSAAPASWVALINDLHASEDPRLACAFDNCREWLREAARAGESLRFISLRDLREPENLVPLLGASRVLLPVWTPAVETALVPFLARLPKSCAISIGGVP